MSRVRNRDTAPEQALRSALHRRGFRFRKHVRTLPGSPDLVFTRQRVCVFIDGDFWHGFRFPTWQAAIPPFWQAKIAQNRARDARNFRRLRENGWIVLRIWSHTIKGDLDRAERRVIEALSAAAGALT